MKDIENFSKMRDYAFAANDHKNKKIVKSTCIETGEIDYFHSLYNVQRDLKINCGIVKMCCEGLNRVKSRKSKNSMENFINFSMLMNYQRDIIAKLILAEKINKKGLKK